MKSPPSQNYIPIDGKDGWMDEWVNELTAFSSLSSHLKFLEVSTAEINFR